MSNAEKNNTETANVAPYMTKNKPITNQAEATKNNTTIPLLLLLISAIVITGSLYEAEPTTQVVTIQKQNNIAADAAPTVSIAQAAMTEPAKVDDTIKNSEEENQAITNQQQRDATSTPFATNQTANINDDAENGEKTVAITILESKEVHQTKITPINQKIEMASTDTTNLPPVKQTHAALLQQRRLAHEDKIQTIRQQRNTEIKAREEKRAQYIKGQKAAFHRTLQIQREARQKIQAVYQRIAELHQEIHQILRKSHSHFIKPQPVHSAQALTEQI